MDCPRSSHDDDRLPDDPVVTWFAYMWTTIAAKSSNGETNIKALKNLAILEGLMSDDQINEANRLAVGYVPVPETQADFPEEIKEKPPGQSSEGKS